ncbi:MAG: hypothetical protein A3F11_03770 [Gammaproteobacteria bacterium RIFCSPHIGHO2_12_FULL_37_14]|nr:MAG: hypothetical protein A3F11_03770 [Gammaproteobacteria bacterium RIFCSPHIGHO2_12_FULL_37_14]
MNTSFSSWYQIDKKQIKLSIVVKPNAKKTAFLKIKEGAMHIALHAKPHHGEANDELILYLAKLFHLPKSQITILRGERSRFKQVLLPFSSSVKEQLLTL